MLLPRCLPAGDAWLGFYTKATDSGHYAAVQNSDSSAMRPTANSDISVCVLAAGMSSRFGSTKLTALLEGIPLVQHALAAAQGACAGQVILVVGHDHNSVVEASAGLSDRVIVNADYEQGIGTSISTGVRALRDGADAILIMLADQPRITTAHIDDIIDKWSGAADEIIASSFDGVLCPPILFPGNAFDLLSRLSGDTGAKKILANDDFTVRSVDFSPAGLDVDTPADLGSLKPD